MAGEKGKALLMLLGKGSDPGKDSGDSGGENYDADLKTALEDLAASLGTKVIDANKGIEAIKTMHDLCSRSEESDEGES